MRVLHFSIWMAFCACGTVDNRVTGPDTNAVDAAPDTDSGSVVEPLPPSPGRELATAAGRLSGGSWAVDVHLGSVVDPSNASGGNWTARTGAPLNP